MIFLVEEFQQCNLWWFFIKGKEVAVIGGGDSRLLKKLFILAKPCKKVYLVHRRDKTYRAAPSTIEHMKTYRKTLKKLQM